jgi:hypothetical protein
MELSRNNCSIPFAVRKSQLLAVTQGREVEIED